MKLPCPWTGLILAASLAVLAPNGGYAAENATNPGFNPDTGQINPGVPRPVPSSAPAQADIPTPAQARAAFLRIKGAAEKSPGTNGFGTGSATGTPPADSGLAAQPSSPPGSTPQTVPAKLSKENDTLDRVPTMAFPLALDDAQRQRVFQAVMDDKGKPASDADKLAPSSALSPRQALDEMHPLPQSIGDVAAVKGLKYLKTKDKVFLADPATRTVVAEIAK